MAGWGRPVFLEVGATDCDDGWGWPNFFEYWRGLSPPHPHERGVPPPPAGSPRGGLGKGSEQQIWIHVVDYCCIFGSIFKERIYLIPVHLGHPLFLVDLQSFVLIVQI